LRLKFFLIIFKLLHGDYHLKTYLFIIVFLLDLFNGF
jgi:hypothetical protein